jgi:TonB family protein
LQADLAKLKPAPQTTPQNAMPNNAPNNQSNKEAAASKTVDLTQPLNVGSLKSLAVRLAVPIYPAIERQRNVEGLVVVEVTLDEKGEVISAKATSGPKSLRVYSEDAAKKSKFKPATFDNKPVKAIGFINYNFKVS